MDKSRREGREGYNYNYSRTRGRNRKWNNASRRMSPYTYKSQHHYNHRASYTPTFNQSYARPPPTSLETRRSGKQSRPASPIEGSEEYMSLKIQQKSALIMRHLLSPNEPIICKQDPIIETIIIDDTAKVVSANEGNTRKSSNKNKKNSVKAEDIYEKIRNYLTKLGKTKMINFINTNSSSYLNTVITQMQQHERLELSRILRDMNSSSAGLVTDNKNPINPDLLLNMEELPEDVIRTLEKTLNIDLSFFNKGIHECCNEVYEGEVGESLICIKDNLLFNEDFVSAEESIEKLPPIDECMKDFPVKEEPMEDLLSNEEFIKDLPVEEKSTEILSDEEFVKDLLVKEELMEDLPNEEFMKDLPVKENSMEDLPPNDLSVKEESIEDFPPTRESIRHLSVNEDLMGDPLPNETFLKDVPVKEECVNSINESDANIIIVPKPMTVFKVEDEDISDSFNISFENFDLKTLLAAQNEDKGSTNKDTITSPSPAINETANINTDDKDTYNFNESSINKVEATLKEIVEAESKRVHTNVDSILANINLIDECCKHLNTYKNVLIKALAYKNNKGCRYSEKSIQTVEIATLDQDNRVGKKQKLEANVSSDQQTQQSQSQTVKIRKIDHTNKQNGDNRETVIEFRTESSNEEKALKLPEVQGLVTVIRLIDNQLLLGTKSGNVIFASKKDGTILHTIDVTNQSITSLAFNRTGHDGKTLMYVGSLDMVLRIYDLKTKEKLCEDGVSDQIRCMDSKWGYVFIGCKDGNLLRYSSEKSRLDFELNNLNLEILSLKATEEGARRVLIVGHRGAEVFVRDAMSGLFLRNFAFEKPTVYSLEFNDSTGNLYCGTAHDNVLVYDFNQGRLLQVFVANEQPLGISCLKLIRNFLFVGCYNGFVYVFNTLTNEKIATLPGPGGGIICMHMMPKQIILSTLNHEFSAIILPDNITLNK